MKRRLIAAFVLLAVFLYYLICSIKARGFRAHHAAAIIAFYIIMSIVLMYRNVYKQDE